MINGVFPKVFPFPSGQQIIQGDGGEVAVGDAVQLGGALKDDEGPLPPVGELRRGDDSLGDGVLRADAAADLAEHAARGLDRAHRVEIRRAAVLRAFEVDDVDMIRLIEDSGAYVCADRYCFGSLPGREEIILNDEEDILTQICRHYMMNCMCPRHMDTKKMNRRREYVDEIAKEYNADGIIYEQMKF